MQMYAAFFLLASLFQTTAYRIQFPPQNEKIITTYLNSDFIFCNSVVTSANSDSLFCISV